MSPSEPLTALSAPEQRQSSEMCSLLNMICLAVRQCETWKADLHSFLCELTAAREHGRVGSIFEYRDWSFCWSPGPADYEYPDSIIELEANLQEAKAAAVLDGTAVQKPSTAFWMVRRSTGSQEAG
jgi:hypothetical protein